MRDYELTFLVRPDIGDEQVKAAFERVQGLITQRAGELTNIQQWGKRRLAYSIAHHREGTYYVLRFRMDPERAKELEHELNLNEQIMRFILLSLDHVMLEALKNPPPPMQAVERRRPPAEAAHAAPPAAPAPAAAPAAVAEVPAGEEPAKGNQESALTQASIAEPEASQASRSARARRTAVEPESELAAPEVPATEKRTIRRRKTATEASEEAEAEAEVSAESGPAEE